MKQGKQSVAYPRTVTCRMTEGDYRILKSKCDKLGLTASGYFRYLVRLPVEAGGEPGAKAVVLDRATLASVRRELLRWGRHYNQAVHALNTIKWGMEHAGRHSPEAAALRQIATALEEVDAGRRAAEGRLASIAESAILGGG